MCRTSDVGRGWQQVLRVLSVCVAVGLGDSSVWRIKCWGDRQASWLTVAERFGGQRASYRHRHAVQRFANNCELTIDLTMWQSSLLSTGVGTNGR